MTAAAMRHAQLMIFSNLESDVISKFVIADWSRSARNPYSSNWDRRSRRWLGQSHVFGPPGSPIPVTNAFVRRASGPQRVFHPLLCVFRQVCVRDVADLFRKLARDLTHVFELFHVALAKGAH